MKFFDTTQIRLLDQYTIEHEPISSVDLMERAANALYLEILPELESNQAVFILAGPGNNGGDALALARMLLSTSIQVKVILLHNGKLSNDCKINKKRLLAIYPDCLSEQIDTFVSPQLPENYLIIDGLFGSGLTRKLEGIFADAVNWINKTDCKIISIDIPSGLSGEENLWLNTPIVKANLTLTLQFPKLSFFFAEQEQFLGDWRIIDIGIHPKAIEFNRSNFYLLDKESVSKLLKKRPKFSHKGTYGHALILAGSYGMAGASVLAGKAALRAGAGLVTVLGPERNRIIVQSSVPELIFQSDIHPYYISNFLNLEKYNAFAVGPGIGLHAETAIMFKRFLLELNSPCVIDADALNLISADLDLLDLIPRNSILTPHPKEFDRIFGVCQTSYERMIKAQDAAHRYNIIIILKGAHTLIARPDKALFFNSSGNAGMATAGTGDVLTGIIVSLLAQGYTSENAAKLAVYLHGKAGDFALDTQSMESLIASDLIGSISKAFQFLRKSDC